MQLSLGYLYPHVYQLRLLASTIEHIGALSGCGVVMRDVIFIRA